MRPSENVLNRHRTGISGCDDPSRNPSPKPGQRFAAHGILFSVLITGALLVFLAGCKPQTQSVSIPVDTTQTFSDAGTQEIPAVIRLNRGYVRDNETVWVMDGAPLRTESDSTGVGDQPSDSMSQQSENE